MAGAFYGYESIDTRFVDWLKTWDDNETACKAALLCVLGAHADSIEEPEDVGAAQIEMTPEATQLVGMGFSARQAHEALVKADGVLSDAINILLS